MATRHRFRLPFRPPTFTLPTPAHPPVPHTETKGIPLEDGAFACLFARHPIWKKVMGKKGKEVLDREAFRAAAWRQAQGGTGRADLRGLAKYYSKIGL